MMITTAPADSVLAAQPVMSRATLASGALLRDKAAGGFTSGWSLKPAIQQSLEQVQHKGFGRRNRLARPFHGTEHHPLIMVPDK